MNWRRETVQLGTRLPQQVIHEISGLVHFYRLLINQKTLLFLL
jgi:hypothetical protein